MMLVVLTLIILVLSLVLINKGKVLTTLIQQVLLDLPSPKSFPISGHYHRFQGKNSEGESHSA